LRDHPQRTVAVSNVAAAAAAGREDVAHNDDLLVGLSFSGDGTRAAAFAFGALRAFDRTAVPSGHSTVSLLDRLDFVSGVSGGSVTPPITGSRNARRLTTFGRNSCCVTRKSRSTPASVYCRSGVRLPAA
jgi:NTE family protein